MKRLMLGCTCLAAALLACWSAGAQGPAANYEESLAGKYTLPDPLVMRNGERVRDAKMWLERRRPEIMEMYRGEMFGRSPGKPAKLNYKLTSTDSVALGGKAIRKQVTVWLTPRNSGPKMQILMYLPSKAKKPVPMFLGLGFNGNDSVYQDRGIDLGEEWVRDPSTKEMKKRTNPESSRGSAAGRWQVPLILAAGYGLATINYADIEPDFDGGLQYGIRKAYFRGGQTQPDADDWGAIAAWAWGLSRAMDYFEDDSDVDIKHVAVFGHSRLGKTALWAAAQDARFALVISNESGEGGAAISRRNFGERVADLNNRFPHWFCANFKKYNGHEEQLPFDSHMLLALSAPRPLYVASAAGDEWSDPRGEFLATVAASPVWELLGKPGVGTDQMPAVNQPVGKTVAYHIREGKHDVTAYDWEQYLKFAAAQWGSR